MSQNTSSAVMAQRKEPHDSLDDFPTPPWAGRALVEEVLGPYYANGLAVISTMSCWEPACNRGYLAEALRPYFAEMRCSDIHEYGYAAMNWGVGDFLWPSSQTNIVDWVITNPPFRLAHQFIERGFDVANAGVAMLVRTSFVEGVGRYNELFSKNPPSIIAQFAERVPMVKGRYDPKVSSATAYCWMVWIPAENGTVFQWIPPVKRRLERSSDWDGSWN